VTTDRQLPAWKFAAGGTFRRCLRHLAEITRFAVRNAYDNQRREDGRQEEHRQRQERNEQRRKKGGKRNAPTAEQREPAAYHVLSFGLRSKLESMQLRKSKV
jgi:hypothetical protein